MKQKKTATIIATRMIDEFGTTRGMIHSVPIGAFLKNDLCLDHESLCG